MPSDHSMFVLFTATYLIAYMLDQRNLRRSCLYITSISAISFSVAVCYSRLYLGVHSVAQVLVGATLGVILGRVWYLLTVNLFLRMKQLSIVFHRCLAWLGTSFLGRNSTSKK
jgi:dolichyldiphosphatase